MVNSQLIKETSNAFKIDERVEKIPQAIPVIEVGVKSVKNAFSTGTSTSNSGNTTVYTTPTDQDFYLTSVCIVRTKDAASDVTNTSIRATIDTNLRNIVILTGITLTASQQGLSISFPHPIKIDRGTSIYINQSKTAGISEVSCCISGFIDEIN